MSTVYFAQSSGELTDKHRLLTRNGSKPPNVRESNDFISNNFVFLGKFNNHKEVESLATA